MELDLKPAIAPAHLKIGFFGGTGTGKTWTAAQLLSQFIAEYVPGSQLAMFDTEAGGGYVREMVKRITGKGLLVHTGHSFAELIAFAKACRERGFVAMLDSATHPWRSLCKDYLDAKKSRVEASGGNPETTKLALNDWGPIKEMWAHFSDSFRYDPVHWCICGREGDVWESVTDEEGNTKAEKTGKKMKTEIETGYEPSILVRMRLRDNQHIAEVVKERFGVLTGKTQADPDIEFFRPHIELLALGGKIATPPADSESAFPESHGMNYATMRKRREAILEEVKDDLLLTYPSTGAADKKGKVKALRHAFNTSAWTKLEADTKAYPLDALEEGRGKLRAYLKKIGEADAKGAK